ncbi:MAG: ornithine carbamoyltransferase [Myxococcales bacterium]|nr:ornithine carbamoyltransferase [Myxococcales bacterium]
MTSHFLTGEELSVADQARLLTLAADIKARPERYRRRLEGRTLAMIFQKKSTRTRVSFEAGMFQLGGHALFLGADDIQIGRGETISDTARVLSRYVDLIMARVYAHADVEELAATSRVPVINGLSDLHHPCQVLADLQTIAERFGALERRHLAYVGDGNNMAHSLLLGCARAGMSVSVATPEGYACRPEIVARARAQAAAFGQSIVTTTRPAEAVTGADAVYTDVWASMGQEQEQARRLRDFAGFQVDAALMAHAKPTAIFLHCLPAHRGEEVSAEVCDGPQSVIFDEAENRLHAQKALMLMLLGEVDS